MEEFEDEEMRREIIEKLKIAEEEIERGDVIDMDLVFKELRKKFGYKKI